MYIALLRGINVSGQKMVKMDALKYAFETLNLSYVRTYLQSGNVVFHSEIADHNLLSEQLEAKILSEFGFRVPVILRNRDRFVKIIINNPYTENTKNLYVTFLSSLPGEKEMKILQKTENYGKDYCIWEDVVFLHCKEGYGNFKFNNNFFENKLKLTATTRNWKTVVALEAMLNGQ